MYLNFTNALMSLNTGTLSQKLKKALMDSALLALYAFAIALGAAGPTAQAVSAALTGAAVAALLAFAGNLKKEVVDE